MCISLFDDAGSFIATQKESKNTIRVNYLGIRFHDKIRYLTPLVVVVHNSIIFWLGRTDAQHRFVRNLLLSFPTLGVIALRVRLELHLREEIQQRVVAQIIAHFPET